MWLTSQGVGYKLRHCLCGVHSTHKEVFDHSLRISVDLFVRQYSVFMDLVLHTRGIRTIFQKLRDFFLAFGAVLVNGVRR